jgi:hypothetical protein
MVVQRNADFGLELATTSVIKDLPMLLPHHAELQIVAAHPANHHNSQAEAPDCPRPSRDSRQLFTGMVYCHVCSQ